MLILDMLVKQKENKMKFEKVNSERFGIEFRLDYIIWERNDNENIIITKMRGTSEYIAENLKDHDRCVFYSLKDAKEFGLKYWD